MLCCESNLNYFFTLVGNKRFLRDEDLNEIGKQKRCDDGSFSLKIHKGGNPEDFFKSEKATEMSIHLTSHTGKILSSD